MVYFGRIGNSEPNSCTQFVMSVVSLWEFLPAYVSSFHTCCNGELVVTVLHRLAQPFLSLYEVLPILMEGI